MDHVDSRANGPAKKTEHTRAYLNANKLRPLRVQGCLNAITFKGGRYLVLANNFAAAVAITSRHRSIVTPDSHHARASCNIYAS